MAPQTSLTKSNTTFSLALFKKLSDEDKAANIFYSPFSISSALAMVLLGARVKTATQISECMNPPQKDQDDIHAKFSQLLSELNKDDDSFDLSVANRLYGEQSYQFIKEYLKKTKTYYSAELESVDFKNSAEAARVNINAWVEKQTQGKIKDLLTPDVVKDSTVLVLVNAIYFKAKWNEEFKEGDTANADFNINKNETKSVKMMHQKSKFPLTSIAEANCQILELPYEGKELSMLIFLPNEVEDDSTGLEKLERLLTYEKFVNWTHRDMPERDVEVWLPRFKMEETYDLNDVLTRMGMIDAFDVSRSNFSGMSAANNLFVSKVIHKAFVDVNEEGTEASAASGVITDERSAIIYDTFKADHPFLFFIRHNATMTILFAGRYCSPE